MNWLNVGLKALPLIFGAITAVERFVKGKGQEKQDAALEMVKDLLATTEGITGKDLLEDSDVADAAKKVIDAVVSFQNLVAKRNAARAIATN